MMCIRVELYFSELEMSRDVVPAGGECLAEIDLN